MKNINNKRFFTSISLFLILFVGYIYYSAHINIISADLLKSKEMKFDYKGNEIHIKNFDFDAPTPSKNECKDFELSNFLKWRNVVSAEAKSLVIKEKQNKNQSIYFKTRSNTELSHFYRLDVASPKSNIVDLLIYTDHKNRIKLIKLNKLISQHEGSEESIYFHPKSGIISYSLSAFEYRSGFSSNFTETESHTAIVCKDQIIDNFNLSSINNQKIIHSVYGIKKVSQKIISEILKK
ncbi:hypothetical protein [Brumimicrobium oceani]|uniref:Uncharacterized protein n=1 Tax=Brumimicrobium oceani TaxID=2100725 RepID=A0A2U2XGB9_9FLAO|nr:hypothetical protein [Brumimicrobium oceani]PWH86842.1 hypothetical protein DIT68_00850 [Brumimicrobium oceani]